MTIHTDETVLNITEATAHWLDKAVIGLNLCPFAKSVRARNQIRFAVSNAGTEVELHADLIAELLLLQQTNPEDVDTTLLIHPWALTDFLTYNDFLDVADATLEELDLAGEIQIASFHPQYQFADTEPDDMSNFTNRSPYPMLHLLRESSVERAVAAFSDAEKIFLRNIDTMRRLGLPGWTRLDVSLPHAEPLHTAGKKKEN
ncbi:MAG TPA: DUF1415 domain-containing protein [Noviherbaspirillum sp.]|uniref:DUF1415 domain-containing protein n=1 Tax=Noviherbaspirillum sp. TaxID=1926288 RepID=UPI002B471CA7|nr:DUF1415 domain-containing protein [Noviherbaspirillum sp.]HJV86549.1 DUF1415 domain-containing protein [Noviherbaspirillum sp.]